MHMLYDFGQLKHYHVQESAYRPTPSRVPPTRKDFDAAPFICIKKPAVLICSYFIPSFLFLTDFREFDRI